MIFLSYLAPDTEVFVSGNGLQCLAKVVLTPTEGSRAKLRHVLVQVANGNSYWVELASCKPIKDPSCLSPPASATPS